MSEAEVIAKRPVGPHPADAKFSIVLAKWGDEYVTWECNGEGYYLGHYFQDDYAAALHDFCTRGMKGWWKE